MAKMIIVTKRMDDIHARLADNPGAWGCGKTIDEAIGSLVDAHRDLFEIKVEKNMEKSVLYVE